MTSLPPLQNQQLSDDSDLRKFRTEIPNIIDDLGLDPFQRALYVHYKRVCGASGGICTEGTRTTAGRTKMSAGQVSAARNELAEKGLIEKIVNGQYVHVKIVDIWELNFAYYDIKDRPSIDGATISQVSSLLSSVHLVNTLEGKCSGDEQSVHTVNEDEQKRSPGETKKEPINKKEPKKKETIAENSALLPDTPNSKMFFEMLSLEFGAMGRRPPQKFPSLACKRKFDARAMYLNGNTKEAIERAFQKGIMSISGITDFIAKWNPVYQNGASNGTHNNQKSSRAPAGRASPGHRADASQQSDDSGGIPAQVAAAFKRLSRASSSGT